MDNWRPRTGKPDKGTGFVLLELLPALVLLLLAIMGSMRLVWTSMEHSRERRLAQWREGVLPLVWKRWSHEDSRLVVIEETRAGFMPRFFPDASWLPADGMETDSARWMVLRRDLVQMGNRTAWKITRLVPAPDGRSEWLAVTDVLKASWPGEGVDP